MFTNYWNSQSQNHNNNYKSGEFHIKYKIRVRVYTFTKWIYIHRGKYISTLNGEKNPSTNRYPKVQGLWSFCVSCLYYRTFVQIQNKPCWMPPCSNPCRESQKSTRRGWLKIGPVTDWRPIAGWSLQPTSCLLKRKEKKTYLFYNNWLLWRGRFRWKNKYNSICSDK